jgi:hypothetical protein
VQTTSTTYTYNADRPAFNNDGRPRSHANLHLQQS